MKEEGWLKEALFILVSAALVIYLTIKQWEKSSNSAELFKLSKSQVEVLEPLVRSFYQTTGRVPWSLADRLPTGQKFVDLLPNGECFANPFTGRRTEPHFFDRIYKEADKGTVAIIVEGGQTYIVVYGEHRTLTRKLRL
jgi:hypothetical protein